MSGAVVENQDRAPGGWRLAANRPVRAVVARTARPDDGNGSNGGYVNVTPVCFERAPAGLPEGKGAR